MANIFGSSASAYLPHVNLIFKRHEATRYHFWDSSIFAETARRHPVEGQRTYWRELFERAHIGALASILRAKRWAEGVLTAVESANLLVMAASLRGLVEAAADAMHGLAGFPETVATEYARISAVLDGSSDVVLTSKGLEDRLVHLLYARKLTKTQRAEEPESPHALTAAEYNRVFREADMEGAIQLYELMCQFTHPAAHSVLFGVLEAANGFYFSTSQDSEIINEIRTSYAPVLNELLPFAFNPSIITLGIINYFNLPHLHTPEVNAWRLNDAPIWRRYVDQIKTAASRG